MIDLKQAKSLIKLARDAISAHFSRRTVRVSGLMKNEFSEKAGVFVTLNKDGKLRGCIGFPEPTYPVYEGVVNAALSAAFSDPRFPGLEKDELDNVTIEISLLSRPAVIEVRNAQDYVKQIKVGRDGLIIRGVFQSGLLLPQVAVEHKWDAKTFLEQTCVKAGLPKDTWLDFEACNVLKFEAHVFKEEKPKGKVVNVI